MFERIQGLMSRWTGRGANGDPTQVQRSMLPPSPRHDLTEEMPDQVAMASFMDRIYSDWLDYRRVYEPEWYVNLAFYIGQQYAVWDHGIQTIREPKAPSYKARFVANRVMPTMRTLMGKLNRGTHIGQAIPIQQTETAFSDARMAERVLRALHEQLQMNETIHEFYLWLLTTGTSFLLPRWDPTIGQPVYLPDGSSMPIGEVAVDVLGPWDVLVPPDLKWPLNRPYRWMQMATYDVEVARQTYPDTLWDIEPDAEIQETSYLERVKSLMTPLTGDQGRHTQKKGSSILLVELNEDPEILSPQDRERFPTGRVTVMASQKKRIASQHVNPYTSPYPAGSH